MLRLTRIGMSTGRENAAFLSRACNRAAFRPFHVVIPKADFQAILC